MKYQVTLICKTGQYKPMSAIVEHEEVDLKDKKQKSKVAQKGLEKICIRRGMRSADLKKYNYSIIKVREYDKDKIAWQNAIRYNEIKKENGWKQRAPVGALSSSQRKTNRRPQIFKITIDFSLGLQYYNIREKKERY